MIEQQSSFSQVCEEMTLVLQRAFTPLKNLGHHALRYQFLVLDVPVIMAPRLDKVMGTKCLPAVRSTDQPLVSLQALMLDPDKMGAVGSAEDRGEDFDFSSGGGYTVQLALAVLHNAAAQLSVHRRTKICKEYNKDLNQARLVS